MVEGPVRGVSGTAVEAAASSVVDNREAIGAALGVEARMMAAGQATQDLHIRTRLEAVCGSLWTPHGS